MNDRSHNTSLPGHYAAALRQAITDTRRLGGTRRRGFDPGSKLLTREFTLIVREWARLNLCSRPDEALAGMCMPIAEELTEFLRGAGIDAIFTLGWMSYQGEAIYQFGPAEIEEWMERGFPDHSRIDVHAWVTLPSAEVIDASWLSTVGIVQNRRELIGAVIVADPDQETQHQYHPVLVDTPLLYRIGLLEHRSKRRRSARAAPAKQPFSALR